MSDIMRPVSDETFETDVLKSGTPVLVDFWAEWCSPCRAIAPVLEELGKEYAGRVSIAKLNIDENPVTLENYGVKGIPTMILFKDGKLVAKQVGPAPKHELKAWLDKNL